MSERPRKLLDQVADAIRRKHYSYRTEQTYVHWIKRFILFHQKRHPAEMTRLDFGSVHLRFLIADFPLLADWGTMPRVVSSFQRQEVDA